MQPELLKNINDCLDKMDQAIMDLSSSNVTAEQFIHLNELVQKLKFLFADQSGVDSVIRYLGFFEGVLDMMIANPAAFDSASGGLMLQAVGTCKHFILAHTDQSSAGAKKRALLPKLFDEVSKAFESLQTRILASHKTPEIRKKFFSELVQYGSELHVQLAKLHHDPKMPLTELMRIIHSVKGNAHTFGQKELVSYAHSLEEVLQKIQTGELELNLETKKYLRNAFESIVVFGKSAGSDRVSSSEVKRYLSSRLLGSGIDQVEANPISQTEVTSDCVVVTKAGEKNISTNTLNIARVIRKPVVLGIPKMIQDEKSQKGWKGLLFFDEGLIPFVFDPVYASAESLTPEWVVIFNDVKKQYSDAGQYALQVDDVSAVLELPYDMTIAKKLVA